MIFKFFFYFWFFYRAIGMQWIEACANLLSPNCWRWSQIVQSNGNFQMNIIEIGWRRDWIILYIVYEMNILRIELVSFVEFCLSISAARTGDYNTADNKSLYQLIYSTLHIIFIRKISHIHIYICFDNCLWQWDYWFHIAATLYEIRKIAHILCWASAGGFRYKITNWIVLLSGSERNEQ